MSVGEMEEERSASMREASWGHSDGGASVVEEVVEEVVEVVEAEAAWMCAMLIPS